MRIGETSKAMGINAVVVDAKDEAIANFYIKYGFQRLTGNPLTLVISIKTLNELFK